MKKSLLCRFFTAGTALFLSTWMIFSSFAAEPSGDPVPVTENTVSIGKDSETHIQTDCSSDLSEAQIALGPGYAANQALSQTAGLTEENLNGPGSQADSGVETAEAGEYLGSFQASGYCSCSNCSGGYAMTYSGTIPQAKHTIAADLDVFPLGTRLVIDGIVYTVEDMGGGIDGNRLDIYFASHEEALAFGLQAVDVYAPK